MLLAIDHVGIAVPDLDAAIAFHRDVLGLRLVSRSENVDQGVSEAELAPSEGGALVQLLAPLNADSPIARFLERRGPGVQQMAYRVHDVRAAAEALRTRGVELLYDTPRQGSGGSLINFTHPRDTGGVLIELVQAPVERTLP